MDSAVLLKFLRKQDHLDEKNYLFTTISFNAAPTLLHSKPSSLMSFTKGKRNLYHLWDQYKADLPQALGVQYIELRRTPDRILVLFYLPELLKQTLCNLPNAKFLMSKGYRKACPVNEALERLKSRMQRVFPHEIGIFLGYPVEDVIGFIEKNGKDYLLSKYWKVYHDPERAKERFDAYDRAKMQIVEAM